MLSFIIALLTHPWPKMHISNLGRIHQYSKLKNKCSLLSSLYNVERPFQRYQDKTSWKSRAGWKSTPLENSKMILSRKALMGGFWKFVGWSKSQRRKIWLKRNLWVFLWNWMGLQDPCAPSCFHSMVKKDKRGLNFSDSTLATKSEHYVWCSDSVQTKGMSSSQHLQDNHCRL